MAGAGAVDGLSADRQHDHHGYRSGDQAGQQQPIETIPPFTGTLVLRESVTTGPFK
jgi:hypothetical protein